MSLLGLLAEVITLLDAAGIPHMVAGSLAGSFHGEPRSTQDIDLVIHPTGDALTSFLAALDPDRFYVGDAAGALARRDAFNLIETKTGWKVDLIIRQDRPFSRSEFDRRLPVQLGDVDVFVATAEDTILAKLEWSRLGGSERQRRDVAGIIAANADGLDRTYLLEWARALGLEEDLRRVSSSAGLWT